MTTNLRPVWVCGHRSPGADCQYVLTDDDRPPAGWARRWQGWGGWTWFCPAHDPNPAQKGGGRKKEAGPLHA